ncbi:MAG TPA: S41 family peptidase [Terriglobia bacterium]|nr:S41 family peptidase [Terriglobia bacterium]
MISSKSKYVVLLLSSILVTYAVVGGMIGLVAAQGRFQTRNGSLPQLDYFSDVLAKIRSDYVDEPSMENVMNGAIRGLVETVDPNGGYLSPKDVAFYKDYDPEKAPGIGASLGRRFGYPIIGAVLPGGPAAKAGISTGDIIESIEGMTTRELNLIQVYELLSSPPGKPVNLSVIRRSRGSAEPEKIPVTREPFHMPSIESRMIEGNIAYVRIPYLGPGKASDTRKQLDGLIKKGATGVILDLRYTAGQNEQEAVDLASLFLDTGAPIGSLEGQKSVRKPLVAGSSSPLTKAPLTVLINQGTMGNAEIVAASITDSHRGQLVGSRTFGSGSVQRLIPMADGYALLLSTAKYFRVNGKEIQDAGISPDTESFAANEAQLDISPEDLESLPPGKAPAPKGGQKAQPNEDSQLQKAIEVLRGSSAAAAPSRG